LGATTKTSLAPLISIALGLGVIALVYRVETDFYLLHAGLQLIPAGIVLFLIPQPSRLALALHLVLAGLLVFLAVIHADNFYTFGPLLRESLDAVFQTTNAEAVSYVTLFSSEKLLPVLLFYWLLVFLATLPKRSGYQPLIGALYLVVGVAAIYQARTLPSMFWETAKDYRSQTTSFVSSRQQIRSNLGELSIPDDRNVILILGESTSRHHLGLYGYPRKTTPGLTKLRDETLVYKDVISSHSHTNESLSRALTFNQRDNYQAFANLPDLFTVLNAAGARTYWLSNQNTIGIWDNSVSVISSQASASKYHDPGGGFTRERTSFDQVLIDSLTEVLNNDTEGGKLIVLHMMATHFPYCDMVPTDFVEDKTEIDAYPLDKRFLGGMFDSLQASKNHLANYTASLNCYDRAVRYTDAQVARVIEIARQSSISTAVLYTADHGEAPLLNSGHDSRQHSHFHVEIPFVLWRDTRFPADVNRNEKRAGSLEDLSYSVAHLMGLQGWPDLNDRSLFSKQYSEAPRTTLNGRVGYDIPQDAVHIQGSHITGDHIERIRANLAILSDADRNKIWAHRVNSGGKMLEVKQAFAGVELDVVYEASAFQVYHPPAEAVNLTLADQLAQDKDNIGIWVDWKNANETLLPEAMDRLEQLHATYNIKDRSIIEISALDKTAEKLVAAGWRTSYYLPTQPLIECSITCTATEKQARAATLWSEYDAAGFNAISFDVRLVPFVESQMLDRMERDSIPTYSWATAVDMSAPNALPMLRPLLQKQWLKVILVSAPSNFPL
jgi:heptose-I-phosphate ethanolaminephosphotransferase